MRYLNENVNSNLVLDCLLPNPPVRYLAFIVFNVTKNRRFNSDKKAPVCVITKRHPVEIHSPG